MSRNRARVLVGLVAVAAAAIVVGVAVLQSGDESAPAASTGTARPAPPLELGLATRADEEAEALRDAERLVDEGDRAGGRARFEEILAANPESVEAAVGAAIASWPDGTVERLEALAAESPQSGVVRLHLGLALLASGDDEGARSAWREVERVDPDSPSALRAEDLLNPQFVPGRPPFVAPLEAPPGLEDLSPEEQLTELERRAERGGVEERLAYGIALQRVGRPVSAREAFESALEADPDSVSAAAAAAVGRFVKDDPSQAFSRLGPLADADESGVVRYHLGLLLSWIGQVEEAIRQLELARDADPGGFYGREAERLLNRLREVE
ncbi:MAG TPA: tetratricopeptide repeat protein [Gaiellaceae bacterium]|nr:tetratricopeptide repeat protein [Gaiellaceae bacterium]